MLQPEYKRDMYGNYMVLREQEGKGRESYAMKMVVNNQIPGLLEVELRTVDQTREYCYNISAKQPLSVLFQKRTLKEKEIKELLGSIIRTLKRGREYLLWEEDFLLDPSYIYLDLESLEPKLVYYSGHEEGLREPLLRLIEYMMDKVDYKDKAAVVLIYGIYKMNREEGCTFERLLGFLEEDGQLEEELGRKERERLDFLQETERTAFMEIEVEGEEEKKKYPIWVWAVCLASVALSLGLVCLTVKSGILFEEVTGGLLLGRMAAAFGMVGALEAYFLWRLLSEKNQVAYIRKKVDYIKPADLAEEWQEAGMERSERLREARQLETTQQAPTAYATALLAEQPDQATALLAGRPGGYLLTPTQPGHYAPIAIPEFPFFIGTLQTKVDCVIHSRMVSRFHAKMELEEGKFYLEDLNSTNGTFLNGIRLEASERREIKLGDLVSFADVPYYFGEESGGQAP